MTNFLEKKMHDKFTLLLLEGRTLVEIVASITIYAWHPESSLNRPHDENSRFVIGLRRQPSGTLRNRDESKMSFTEQHLVLSQKWCATNFSYL